MQDHLGNTRVMFSDLNNNGTLFTATTAQVEIIQVNHYYPFEMNMEGPWNGSAVFREYTLSNQMRVPLRTSYVKSIDQSGNVLGGLGPRMISNSNTPILPLWYKS